MFGKGEAKALFADTGFDKRHSLAIGVSHAVSRLSSHVELPEKIELPTDRPVLVAANHSSLFDLAVALIFIGNFGIHSRIGVNARFFKNPVLGAGFTGIGCIPFSKDDGGAAESQMVDALVAGQAAALMPEGRITRNEDQVNGVGQGRPGISRITRAANAAIVPVGIAFSNEAWQPGTVLPKPRFGRHTVVTSAGAPILFDSDDHIANANLLMDRIGELVIQGRESRT